MLQERINRVINNHQLSCGHTSHYIFVLKGFTDVLSHFSVPVDSLDVFKIHTKKNFYITYEEALSLGEGIINELKENDYDPWVVDFNWFKDGYISNQTIPEYTSSKKWHHQYFVSYPSLDFVPPHKFISIFNTTNPLTGITDVKEMDNEERYTLYSSWFQE